MRRGRLDAPGLVEFDQRVPFDELFDDQRVQYLIIWEVIVLDGVSHLCLGAKNKELVFDEDPYVVGNAGKRLTEKSGCFLGAKGPMCDEGWQQPPPQRMLERLSDF
jgi:hypothetical protein